MIPKPEGGQELKLADSEHNAHCRAGAGNKPTAGSGCPFAGLYIIITIDFEDLKSYYYLEKSIEPPSARYRNKDQKPKPEKSKANAKKKGMTENGGNNNVYFTDVFCILKRKCGIGRSEE